jgi:glutamyl-Q tRNA(Asp) synthetase
MHLGHAYSALLAWQAAGCDADRFLLRIDDIDSSRCKDEYTDQIMDDLQWLGISWSQPPLYQSARSQRYNAALEWLESEKLVYPCYLSRKEYEASLAAPQNSPNSLPALSTAPRQTTVPALRLDMDRALAQIKQKYQPLIWQTHTGELVTADPRPLGNVVLGRRNSPASYHLSVVLDDADSQIDLVVRGDDLRASTDLHCLIQTLLSLPSPLYYHHELICDETGQRLAKRDNARSLSTYRENGLTIDDVKSLLPRITPS